MGELGIDSARTLLPEITAVAPGHKNTVRFDQL